MTIRIIVMDSRLSSDEGSWGFFHDLWLSILSCEKNCAQCFFVPVRLNTIRSRVPEQNGISQACHVVQIYHSL